MVLKCLEIGGIEVLSRWVLNDVYLSGCAFGKNIMGLTWVRTGVGGNWRLRSRHLIVTSEIQVAREVSHHLTP